MMPASKMPTTAAEAVKTIAHAMNHLEEQNRLDFVTYYVLLNAGGACVSVRDFRVEVWGDHRQTAAQLRFMKDRDLVSKGKL